MDDLDRALEAAWARVGPRIRADEARRRGLRREGKRPVAPWCLCIRASDPRITDYRALIDDREAAAEGRAHTIVLGAELVRDLFRPVRIAWPGVPYKHAAYLLGRSPRALHNWIKRGVVRTRRSRTQGGRGWGKYELCVWTEGPVNTGAHLGRGPDAVWGTAWQGLGVPDDFEVIVRRERGRTMWDGEGEKFGGWEFVCPGLVGGEKFDEVEGPRAEVRACGRRVDKLYVPVGVVTWVGQAIGNREQGTGGGEGKASPPPTPSLREGALTMPRMRAACARCHGVVNGTLYGRKGWNRFVAAVTGGMLYGHEVERPYAYTRQRKKKRRLNDAAPQRERVCGLFLAGLNDRRIAARLGIGAGTVRNHITRLYRRHGVRGRAALGAKLGVEVAPGTARGDPSAMEGSGGYRLPRRKAEILGLMRKGKRAGEIARELGVALKTVYRQQARLYVLYRVHSRAGLVAKVEALRRARVKGVLEPRAKRRGGLRLVG